MPGNCAERLSAAEKVKFKGGRPAYAYAELSIINTCLHEMNRLAEDPNFSPNVYHRYGWTPLVSFWQLIYVGNFYC